MWMSAWTRGTVAFDLADQNRVTLEQVWDAIKRIGFTPGETKVIVRGAVKGDSLTISGIDKTAIKVEGRVAEAENVELKGTKYAAFLIRGRL